MDSKETGWPDAPPAQDDEFLEQRRQREHLVERFLSQMAAAGNPGTERSLGSTIKELTGQHDRYNWAVTIPDDSGTEREFVVSEDGRHGWAQAMRYSDRPLSPAEEPTVAEVERALKTIQRGEQVS